MHESYSAPGFSAFYDALVTSLPEEYECGKDIDLYWSLLVRILESRSHAKVLDLCTGTGRVVCGLAARLATCSSWAVHFVGLDSSQEMLAAAEHKLGITVALPPNTCRWVLGDMACLGSCQELGGPFDLFILSAGSFHHLLTRQEQCACLLSMQRLLAAHPEARAVLNLLPSSHLQSPVGSKSLAGGFLRECLDQERQVQPDGGTVWRQRFRLSRLPPQQQQEGGAGSSCGPGAHLPPQQQEAGASGSCGAGAQMAVTLQGATVPQEQEEGWALREVEPGELSELLLESGLAVVEQRLSFGGGDLGWEGPGRVFVVRLPTT